MGKATANEKRFRRLFSDKFGGKILEGGKTFKDKKSKVSISVDETFNINDKKILVEIDSGNYAKLLVGQYVLLNDNLGDSHLTY